jgi:hypothetical protein
MNQTLSDPKPDPLRYEAAQLASGASEIMRRIDAGQDVAEAIVALDRMCLRWLRYEHASHYSDYLAFCDKVQKIQEGTP